MKRFAAVLAVLAVAGLASFAAASSCVAPVKSYSAYVPAYVAQLVPVVVQVPTYSVSYTPPPAAAQQQTEPADLASVIAELRALRETVARLTSGAGTAATPAPTFAAIIESRCASCHGSDSADAKGAGFVLWEGGKVPPLSLTEQRRIMTRLTKGQMPPDQPLPEAEINTVRNALTQGD